MKFTWIYILIFIIAASVSAQETYIIKWGAGAKDLQSTLEVEVGDKVKWIFDESIPQNLLNTSLKASGDFGTKQLLPKGAVYEYVFSDKGFYTFQSGINKNLKGSIRVSENSSVLTQTKEGFKIYPNPVKDRIYFKNPDLSNSVEITFYDVLGKMVKRNAIDSGVIQGGMDVSRLKRGVYLVQIDTGARSFTQKLIKD
ncbi:T9SS type A sorting domain-containing protein [Leeuwenhoekiella sp. CH_XMU1409-2]|uniref:T9SS type A sorting domain-containing protein n=1 Tax=Leeuwenhoekiella sp. CH_XMU1409-2 TaxID=3107768 RepID=UPI00300A69FF